MKKREFYTLENLKEFLKFDNRVMKLSEYCKRNSLSMVIPLGTTIGQSVPVFFEDTSESTPGSIIFEDTKVFEDIKEIVNYWIEERPRAKYLHKVDIENPQRQIELLVKYMISFSHLSEKRKSFPVDITKIYEIEELWMREGYISIISINHIKDGFNNDEKQSMKDIDKSFFAYIKDKIDMM